MAETGGIRKAGEGFDGASWDILGQTYVPKHVSEECFSWHATFPAGSFVPQHSHPTQDEFIFMLEGEMEFVLDGQDLKASPGDLVALPKGIPHSIHNRSDRDVKCLFWVAPTRRLFEYFGKIDGMQDKDEMARLAGEHEVPFD